MGIINISIPDDIDDRVREKIGKEHGKRGALKSAVTRGLELWLSEREKQ
jgi:hypothetical protein